jgi:microcystin degradation protein MlrC
LSKRVYIAALGTETNQFVPFPTGLRGYEEHGIWRGDATKHEPTNFTAPLHTWRKKAEDRGWTVIEGLATFAAPSGTTVRSVYEGFREEILAGISAALPLDAVLINVHGAMVADGYDDCEVRTWRSAPSSTCTAISASSCSTAPTCWWATRSIRTPTPWSAPPSCSPSSPTPPRAR